MIRLPPSATRMYTLFPCPPLFRSHGLWFESSSQAYQAAREGAGVALGQPVFLLRDLREGRLVAPFRLAIESPWSYWIASLLRRADEPHIVAFREWLIEERDSTQKRSADSLH